MRKFMIALTSLVVAAGVLAYQASPRVPANAQAFVVNYDPDDINFVTMFGDDDDSAGSPVPVIWAKYVGPDEVGTIDLNSNAIEFHAGPLGTPIAALTTELDDVNRSATADDVCGSARSGLDVTNAACDTPNEIVGVIRDAQYNVHWMAVVAGVLGTETLATAAEYEDMADRVASGPGGQSIFIDQTDVDTLSLLIRPDANDTGDRVKNLYNLNHGDIEFFLTEKAQTSRLQTLKENPFKGQRFALTALTVEADTTGAFEIHIYARRYSFGTVTDRLMYSRVDLTADASTEEEFNWLGRSPLITEVGETMLVQIVDGTLVTGRISASGYYWRP